jgi:DNA mismatch endonuclease (patch repair protein)
MYPRPLPKCCLSPRQRDSLEIVAGYISWASSPGVRSTMRANRRRNTAPEMAVRRLVHAAGLRYRVDARPIGSLNRRADLVFSRAKVAVFIDGCYWHGCPEHGTKARTNTDYWVPKIARNRERDAETDRLLADAGWQVIRVWEHEDAAEVALIVGSAVRGLRTDG